MVVAAHPLASEAGLSVLEEGGNAVDAALAALFMLNVVEPHASGLGGGGFAIVRMSDGEAKVVNYRERAPAKIDPSIYTDPADTNHIRMKLGGTSVCVPSAAAGWAEMYERWHTLPLERLTRDAIRIAEEGFPVNPTLADLIAGYFDMISQDSLLAETFLKKLDMDEPSDSLDQEPVLLPYEVGDTLRQPKLAETIRTLTKRGLRSFYRGPIAEAIVEAVTAGGGKMTIDDLEFCRIEVTDPIRGEYRGYEILTVPPPSRGGAALIEALNLFEITGATDGGLGDPVSIHLMSQCFQQAYTDARFLISDPAVIRTDWQRMLTVEHARLAAEGISAEAEVSIRSPVTGDLKDHGNTTHLVIVDSWGNAVSLTQSINHFFGAGVMAGRTGLFLNDLMADFSLPQAEADPTMVRDTLNFIMGNKRPRSNMTPLIMLKDNSVVLVVGTPGGSRIIAAVAQIVVNVVDFNLDISAAIDYPRFFPVFEQIVIENRCDIKMLKFLKKAGYQVLLAPPYHVYFGGAHGITLPPLSRKVFCGAADKRRGGAARGY